MPTRADRARFGHWIDGAVRDGADLLPVRDPATGAEIGELVRGDAADVAAAVSGARAAQQGWARRAPADRGAVLVAVADGLAAGIDELVRLECAETGKPDHVARDELLGAADYFRFYGAAVRTATGEVFDAGPTRHLYVEREAYGVIGMITPWNYAANQAARGAAPALACGNAVVVKPSEFASTTILALARLAGEAGLPPGLLNVVVGDGAATGRALVESPGVDKVVFTGSVATGRAVAAAAAQRLVPATLELGGKSPYLVFADADLDLAAADVAEAIFYNAGQTCSAGSRLLVDARIHDALVERLVAHARAHVPGRDSGPIITRQQHATVLEYIEIAQAEGAVAVAGGRADGWCIEPTVYTGVTGSMRVAQEEIFGPVLVVIPFADEAEAVALANGTPYALVAGVWTRDLDRSFRIARALDAGQVYVNGWGAPIDVPFGGNRLSGYGREKGVAALDEYSRSKGICLTLRA